MERLNVKMVLIIVGIFVIGWWIMVVFAYKKTKRQATKHKQHTEEVYGNIQFKGEVLKIHRIDRWGRIYGMMCIKLDYTNVDNFYRFDDMSCLKIKNGIATLPTSFIGNDEGYDKRVNAILSAAYIEVNIDNSKQRVFIDKLGNKYLANLFYGSGNLIESDMRLCDDCK